MFGGKEIGTMVQSEWVKLTLQDSGKIIRANLANVTTIEGHKKGSRIWFLPMPETVPLTFQRPEEILKQLGEVQEADRS
jgi:hypothetical protein